VLKLAHGRHGAQTRAYCFEGPALTEKVGWVMRVGCALSQLEQKIPTDVGISPGIVLMDALVYLETHPEG